MPTTFNYLGNLAHVVPWSSLSGCIENSERDENLFLPQRKMRCEYEYVPAEFSACKGKRKHRIRELNKVVLFKRLKRLWKKLLYVLRSRRAESSWRSFIALHSFSVVIRLNLVLSHRWNRVCSRVQHKKLYLFFKQSSVNGDLVIRGSRNTSWLRQL